MQSAQWDKELVVVEFEISRYPPRNMPSAFSASLRLCENLSRKAPQVSR